MSTSYQTCPLTNRKLGLAAAHAVAMAVLWTLCGCSSGGTPNVAGDLGSVAEGGDGAAAPLDLAPDQRVASGCTGNARQCDDANDVQECQASRWVTLQSCPLGCVAGACATTATTCKAGEYSCIGNTVARCNPSGSGWLYGSLCPGTCAAGLCVGACSAATVRCNGSRVETCAADGMSWMTTQTCTSGCDSGQCVLDRLDVTSDTDLNGLVIVAGPVNVFDKATLRSSKGDLTLRAQSITVDAGGAIVAAATGKRADGRGSDGQYCTDMYSSHSGGGGGGYGTRGNSGVSIGYTCGGSGGGAFGAEANDQVSFGSAGGDETKGGTAGGLGGGVLRLSAATITIAGTVSANGGSGGGTGLGAGGGAGGGIMIAADKLTVSGTVSAQGGVSRGSPGSGQGGLGRIKLLWGASHSITGTVTGVTLQSVLPPFDLSSVTHPSPARSYNDDFTTLALGWSLPFPSRQGYYFRLDGQPVNPPNAGSGTLAITESILVPRAQVLTGDNYLHFISVDAMTNLGSLESTFHLLVNAAVPSMSSMTHPDPNGWSSNVNPLVSWTLPSGDDNYRGTLYALDHYGNTVPTFVDTLVPAAQHQVLIKSLAPGIWAFHAVSVDTVGNRTRAAAHYVLRIGADPGSGTVLGQVSGPAGNVANATVSVNRGLLPGQATNSTGVFSLANVPAGTWEVTVSASGLKTSTQMATVKAASTTTLTFMLSP